MQAGSTKGKLGDRWSELFYMSGILRPTVLGELEALTSAEITH